MGLDLSESNKVAQTAQDQGNQAINSFDPQTTAGAQKGGMGDSGLGGLLGGETSNYVSDYANAVKNNPTVTQLYQQGNSLYNVPQLAQTATNLSNRLTDVMPNAYQGARGFDINSTDINNAAAQSSAYLGPQSGRATANYNTAAGLASQFVTAGQAQNAQNLLPVQAQGTLLQQQEAGQISGWNQANANEFEGLIQKMSSGVQLSVSEMARANTLAEMETSYQNALTQATASQNVAQIGNQYKTLSPSQTLANTFTGSTKKF